MIIALTVVHVLMCFAIIAIVLLQSGKGADIGSAFGGAGSQAVFGSMSTPTVLGKVTTVVAIVFTLTSFSLALLGGERSGTGSVVRERPAPAAPAPPATTAPAPAPAAPATPAPPAAAPTK
jgi:preprotein translocase subunit SecG